MMPHSTLQLVQIYFDTATFDDIEKEKKVKFDAQLSLIGGTMGLLSGFSIISGIEIVFFLFRLGRLNSVWFLSADRKEKFVKMRQMGIEVNLGQHDTLYLISPQAGQLVQDYQEQCWLYCEEIIPKPFDVGMKEAI